MSLNVPGMGKTVATIPITGGMTIAQSASAWIQNHVPTRKLRLTIIVMTSATIQSVAGMVGPVAIMIIPFGTFIAMTAFA